jgi:TusA-related sulfurtransferase
MLFVMSTSESFAQQVTKNDLIEVLPDCTAFQKRIDPFIHYLGYAKEGRILNGLAFFNN